MKKNTYIILVEPENPDNIGAVCRAMKNMDLFNLRVVSPPKAWRKKAEKMAMHAHDVLYEAEIFRSLDVAVEDLNLTVGTTRRGGPRRGAIIPLPEALQKMQSTRKRQKIGILFGKESKGLDNESLGACDWVTTIPTSKACPSLNLSQAVMLFSFCLYAPDSVMPTYTRRDKPKEEEMPLQRYVSKKEVGVALDHFESALEALEYQKKGSRTVERIRATMHRLIKRSGLVESEAQMLKGLSRRIKDQIGKKPLKTK